MSDRRHFLTGGAGLLVGTGLPALTAAADEKPTPASLPLVVAADEGTTMWAMGVLVTVKVRAKDTGGAYSVFEDIIPPGGGPPPHTHTKEDETIYVVEGELVAFLDGKRYDVKAGSWVHMPRGVSHSFKNMTDKLTRMILTYSPGGFEQWFSDIGKPAKRTETEPPKLEADYIKKAAAAAEKYGVRFAK